MIFLGRPITVLLAFLIICSCSHRHFPQPPLEAAPPSEPFPSPAPSGIVAVVGDEVITMEALEERLHADQELSEEIEGLEEAVIDQARQAVLERMIAEILIQKESERQCISPDELLKMISEGISVSEYEVERSYQLAERYKGGHPVLERRTHRLLAGSEQEARKRIRQFLREQKAWMAVRKYVYALKERVDIKIFLPGIKSRSHNSSQRQ